MNEVLDASPTGKFGGQSMGRQGLGLEMTNQRSVSSVLTKASEYNLHPQDIADAGLKVRVKMHASSVSAPCLLMHQACHAKQVLTCLICNPNSEIHASVCFADRICGVQFIDDHVQMEDVRLYVKDVLKEYASLQTATQIQPSWNAVCYTGQLVLDQFAFPYRLDKQVVVQAYPWLQTFAQDSCPTTSDSKASDSAATESVTVDMPQTSKLK